MFLFPYFISLLFGYFHTEANDSELISILLDGGADMSIVNSVGESADKVASDPKNQEMIRTKRRKSISSNAAPLLAA